MRYTKIDKQMTSPAKDKSSTYKFRPQVPQPLAPAISGYSYNVCSRCKLRNDNGESVCDLCFLAHANSQFDLVPKETKSVRKGRTFDPSEATPTSPRTKGKML